MKKKYSLLMLSIFLCISTYSQAGFFSFFTPCWKVPVVLFYGFWSLVRDRLPIIITKNELNKNTKKIKKDLGKKINELKESIINDNIKPLEQQQKQNNLLIQDLLKQTEDTKQEVGDQHKLTSDKINNLKDSVKGIQKKLFDTIKIHQGISTHIEQEKQDIEVNLQNLNVEIRDCKHESANKYNKLRTQLKQMKQSHLQQLEKIEMERQYNHEELLRLAHGSTTEGLD